MSKSSKKYLNTNLTNLLSSISHKKNNIKNSPYNISNKDTFKNNLEIINKNANKEFSSKKSKDKQKRGEVLVNNFFSQRSRLNTEGNDNKLKKLQFTSNFLRNKIEFFLNSQNYRSNSKKINITNKNIENNNNFRNAKKLNNTKNSEHKNKIKSNNGHFTKLITNSNKKIIDENSYNNEYNITNIHNRSNTQVNFKNANKKTNNSSHKLKSYSSKYRNANKFEDIKKTNINKKIKGNNITGAIRQVSPFYYSNNRMSNTQNYLKNTSKKNKTSTKQNNKERQILLSDPKETKNTNNLNNNEFIMKENSSYLVISKKPTQITNFIEKKENNKYINNYFNICENKKNELNCENNNEYISYEEIHFFFVKQIQMGNKLYAYVNSHEG